MTAYVALIFPEGPSNFGAVVPDCPGCTTAADTLDETLSALTDALRLWATAESGAGRTVPPPRPLDELMNEPDVRRAIKDGAILAATPLLMDEGRPMRVNVSLDAGLVSAIDSAARARGLTRSAFLASAARDKIAG